MSNSSNLKNGVASQSPTANQPTEKISQLQNLIKQEVLSALSNSGLNLTTESSVPRKEGLVNRKLAKMHPLPLDPTDPFLKRQPHIRSVYGKDGQFLHYLAIWPAENGCHPRIRRYESRQDELESLRKRFRDEMVEAIDSNFGDNPVSLEDRVTLKAAKDTFLNYGLPGKLFWHVLDFGIRLYKAATNHDLDPVQVIADGVDIGVRRKIMLDAAIVEYLDQFSKGEHLKAGNQNYSNARAILNFLKAEFPNKSLYDVLTRPAKLKAFSKTYILEKKGEVTSLARSWSELWAFLDFAAVLVRVPVSSEVLGKKPVGKRRDVRAPKPTVIRKFLFNILANEPELLPIAVLCVFVCRPQEAYLLAMDVRKAFKGKWIHIPLSKSKGGCTYPRDVRLRPVLAAWFRLFPGWLGSVRTDFRPRWGKNKDKFHTYGTVEKKLNRYLIDAGWEGDCKESLRKAFLSAQVCMLTDRKNDMHYAVKEAGHANTKMIEKHYDGDWEPAEGNEFFSMFPLNVVNPPTRNLHQAFDQQLDFDPDESARCAPAPEDEFIQIT